MDAVIRLIEPGENPVEIYADVQSAGRNDFAAAGQNGYKADYIFVVWAAEYDKQAEVEYDDQRLTIYRTYVQPRNPDRLELHTEERVGKRVNQN